MKKQSWVGCVLVGMFVGTLSAMAADDKAAPAATNAPAVAKEVKAQTTCPVMGEPINKKLFVDVEGKRIYVCCKACVKTVTAEPAKYVKILEDAGITLDKAEPAAPAAKDVEDHKPQVGKEKPKTRVTGPLDAVWMPGGKSVGRTTSDGALMWRTEFSEAITALVEADGTCIATDVTGKRSAIQISTGQLLWTK